MATDAEIQSMRRLFQKRLDPVMEDVKVDDTAGKFQKNAPDRLATPPDFNRKNEQTEEETVVMSKGELRKILTEAMQKGQMVGSLQHPENTETIAQYDDQGNFDEEQVNVARRIAERNGDLTHVQKKLLERAKLKKQFTQEKIITFDMIQNEREKYTTRKSAQ
jgi:hypothetical protein